MATLILVRYGQETKRTLPDGIRGNIETLREMARFVREDSQREDVRNFIHNRVVNYCSGHAFDCEVRDCFKFASTEIVYRRDSPGVERVADFWTTTRTRAGDCSSKTIWLCTALAVCGNRPFFIALGQSPFYGQTDWSFDHVFCGLQMLKDGKPVMVSLDPTPENAQLFKMYGQGKYLSYPIF